MFSNYIKVRLVAFLTVLLLPGGLLAADCLTAEDATADLNQPPPLDPGINPEETGYAISIQSDQGQGSINCGDFQGQFGPMSPLPITQQGGNGSINSRSVWTILDSEGPSADLVFAASNDGARCTQFYAGNATSGYAAAGSKGNKPRTLVACTDGVEEELPPEPPVLPTPPQITGEDCPTPFQDAINLTDQWDVLTVFGGSGVNEGGSIVCVDQTLNQPAGGNLLAADEPVTLNRCVNRCITPETTTTIDWFPLNDTANRGAFCEGAGVDGRYPIQCRVCELTEVVDSDFFEPDLPFCWRQGQDVQPNDPATSASTMKLPPPDQGNQAWTVNGKFGSTCYLISGRTRSGYPYSYWAPSGCPN